MLSVKQESDEIFFPKVEPEPRLKKEQDKRINKETSWKRSTSHTSYCDPSS
jgi:hypothetical protein